MNPTNLKLPPRRLDQLKAIGDKLGLSVADTVAHLIRKEIAAGTIPDTIPGILVEKVKDGVKVAIDNGEARTFPKEAAVSFAQTIRGVVDGNQPTTIGLNKGSDYAVIRRGTGYKIMVPFPGKDNSFSGDLARDFADLIERAAA
ncbi:hypothetical protein IHQ71_06115 [Rhizobium sp. TH2]|uniref:hypothetical protein n=1 Tax=Rhizobium sp. TH2 TaxID=2775403 RepID=UPI002157A809|nr:hypothetical protein [Rhizobium sp. TH2]UVC10178.1 hypothetical protein IHQ71_06115 [Rhizobium sp. TH2]